MDKRKRQGKSLLNTAIRTHFQFKEVPLSGLVPSLVVEDEFEMLDLRLNAEQYADFQRRMDKEMLTALAGHSTSNIVQEQRPFTLKDLDLLRVKLPKPTTCLSSKLFPHNEFWRLEASSEDFFCAHPGLWRRVEHEARKVTCDASSSIGNPLLSYSGFQILEIDPRDEDTTEQADWRWEQWERLLRAIEVASIPLPEWLKRNSPYSKNGRYGSSGVSA